MLTKSLGIIFSIIFLYLALVPIFYNLSNILNHYSTYSLSHTFFLLEYPYKLERSINYDHLLSTIS